MIATLPVSGLHAELNVGGEQIASGVSNRAFVVPAHGQSEFDMTITANMALAMLKLANQHARLDRLRSDRRGESRPALHAQSAVSSERLILAEGVSLSH